MASHDLHHNVQQVIAFNGATISTDTTTNGNIVDTQFFEALEFIIQVNAWTSGQVIANLQEGDDSALADATTVTTQFLLGSLANTVLNSANSAARIGYVGKKRYARLQLISSLTASLYASAVAVKGVPHTAPTDPTLPPM